MSFTQFFTERTDPDVLFTTKDPSIHTFIIVPGVGYLYGASKLADGQFMPLNHGEMRYDIAGKIIGTNKIRTHRQRIINFHLLPGKKFPDLLAAVRETPPRLIEGRVSSDEFAVWQSRPQFEEYNKGNLMEHMLKSLSVDPSKLSYNFAEIGDLPYDQIYGAPTKLTADQERRKQEMDILRKIHLDPMAKRAVIPSNDKAQRAAHKQGYKSIAQMKNRNVIGDSFGA
jgi:hypothetical protein